MIRGILLAGMFILSPYYVAADGSRTELDCPAISLEGLYQNYVVFDVVKYGGGITSEVSAMGYFGKSAVIARDNFQVRDTIISDPTYELACYPAPKEGEVDGKRWSSFYGFGLDRTAMNVLYVHEGHVDDEPSVALELVDGKVWYLHDGWLYKMKIED